MSVRKKKILIYSISILGSWLLLFYFMIQVYCTQADNKEMTFLQALGGAWNRIVTSPLKIFPIPVKAFGTTMLIALMIAFIAFIVISDEKTKAHYSREKAKGDAKWLKGKELEEYNKKYTEPFGSPSVKGFNNIILANDFYQSMDNKETGRNCNTIVIAGSGRGKSFRFVGPNLLNANASFITTDPSGSLFRQYGTFFEHKGYKIKCVNLAKMNYSNHYNPFTYLHTDKDIMVLVDVLIANTTPPESHSGDPFWEKAEAALFNAIIALQKHYLSEELQNFSTTLELIRMGNVSENGGGDDDTQLGRLFKQYELDEPNSFAVKQYGNFIMGAGKTIKSILVSCAFRIKAFDLQEIRELTSQDDLELDSVGDEKTALFIIIPTGEKTFNFLAAMMYSQLFIRLYDYCETTAVYSQLIKDEKGEVIKTFRAKDEADAKEVRKTAERFTEEIKHATIIYNRQMEWYELRTPKKADGHGYELISYRKTEEEAEEALSEYQTAHVTNNGEKLPIHTRLMLDEFANIGNIPDFDTKVSTIRKYAISTNVILQSIFQLQHGDYEKSWSTLTGNSDNIIYMGGGADTETTKWFSELIGKETRQVASQSFNRNSGSMSISSEGIELAAPYQLRTLKNDELIVLPVGLPPFRGKMYDTLKHPNWHYVANAPKYRFDITKTNYFLTEELQSEYKPFSPADSDDFHGGYSFSSLEEKEMIESRNERVNKENQKIKKGISAGVSSTGDKIVSAPQGVDKKKDTVNTSLGIKSEKDVEAAAESMFTLNRSLGSLYTVYDSAPIDRMRKKTQNKTG